MNYLASNLSESPIFGNTIELNLLGSQKLCSFDCPYCNLGPTTVRMTHIKKEVEFPLAKDIDRALRDQLKKCLNQTGQVETILISGNGEPTLHPDYDNIVNLILDARKELARDAKIVLLTNGAQFKTNKIINATNKLDESIIKLDAGNDKTFKSTNAPLIRADLSRISSGARNLKNVTIQSLFFAGEKTNASSQEVDDWIELVGVIKPTRIMIHTVYEPPSDKGCLPLTEDDLYIILSKLKRKLNIESQVYYW